MIHDHARLACAAVAVQDAITLVQGLRRRMTADGACQLARSSRERSRVRDELLDCSVLLKAALRDLDEVLDGQM